MDVSLVFEPSMARYDLGESHPLRPERFTLAVDLMDAYGLLTPPTSTIAGTPARHQASVVGASAACDDDLALVHEREYLETVKRAGTDPRGFRSARGIGPGDTPAFAQMHEASALVAGATCRAVDIVAEGRATRAFSVAGGLHHAHRDRAAGFCVYNDPAVAIARATRDRPGLRVAYVDIDAHHGDGVEEAFYERPDVLTVSVHESGRYLFPGTGQAGDIGVGAGRGYAVNVPMPPGADDPCYQIAFDEAIGPAVRAFAPDLVVAQCGADALRADPLTHLMLSLRGHRALVDGLVALADELCDGHIVATGGGGYDTYSAVPRAWCNVLAALMVTHVPDALPEAWRNRAAACAQTSAAGVPAHMLDETVQPLDTATSARLLNETRRSIERVRQASPLLDG